MSAKPTAEIDLVNLSLMQLHQGEVTSLLDTNDPVAQLALIQVAPTRRMLLRSSALWNFAKKRDTAARVTNITPKFDYDSFYQLPQDLLRLHYIGEERDRCNRRYDIQGRFLLLDGTDASVPVTYTRDEEDISLWDALFVDCFILQLAIKLAFPVTGDRGIQRELRDQLKELLPEAAIVDLQERPLQFDDHSNAQRARESLDIHSDIRLASNAWD